MPPQPLQYCGRRWLVILHGPLPQWPLLHNNGAGPNMCKAHVRPGAIPLWSLTRPNPKGLYSPAQPLVFDKTEPQRTIQSCPAASMAEAAMLLPVATNNCCACPMPKYYRISKHCLIQASPFWSRSMPIVDILATTCLGLTFYQMWLGVYMSFWHPPIARSAIHSQSK